MPLTLAQKSDVRRHLRYPVGGLFRNSPAGGSLADGSAGYRYFQEYGFLEWRLNNLMPDEEARLTGGCYGGVAFMGPAPNPGDTCTVTLSGGGLASPVAVTVTAATGDTTLSMIARLAAALAGDVNLIAAQFFVLAPYGTGAFSQAAIPVPELAIVNTTSFSVATSFTGILVPEITSQGAQLQPSLTDETVTPAVVYYGYLPILNFLESAYAGTTNNLDTAKADVWTARRTELPERMSLYATWQGKLSEYIDIPINPRRRANFKQLGMVGYM